MFSLNLTMILLKNNYKTQTILLVRQGLKQISFLTNGVWRTQFCSEKIECETLDFEVSMEIEYETLDFQVQIHCAKSSAGTRIVKNQLCLKRCLTNNIDWIL